MTGDTHPATVLVVEDEQPLADLYARFLEPRYTVSVAYDGAMALDRMNADVDVVLLDRRMPGIPGEDVLRHIRNKAYDCRVAMVTAVTPDADILEMGFDDYLTKPVGKTELIETVDQLLRLSSYDGLLQEYYQLASKKAALEAEIDDIDRSTNDEFHQLADRIDRLKAELQTKRGTAFDDFRGLLGGR